MEGLRCFRTGKTYADAFELLWKLKMCDEVLSCFINCAMLEVGKTYAGAFDFFLNRVRLSCRICLWLFLARMARMGAFGPY